MSWLLRVLVVVVTAASVWASAARLRVSADLSTLFPAAPSSAALAQYARVFGGGDLGIVLVRAESAAETDAAALEVAKGAVGRASISGVVDRAPAPPESVDWDASLAWRYAMPDARRRLADALTPQAMADRLAETRAMLLAPGSASAEEQLARDPLRLMTLPFEARAELAASVEAAPGGAFVADQGRARLVLLVPRGNAFESGAAAAFVGDVDAIFRDVHAAHPSVRLEFAGGHAIARATELMLRRDLTLSGGLSMVLASVVFLATFRRLRALVAVLPPLVLGTLWTMGVAAVAFEGLSAIAIAFAAVVVGVGVDTGVHVYAALLDARRAGLSPKDAARGARRATWRPTLLAAVIAGAAFASLAFGDLAAMAQLGLLSGLGEVLTAAAILIVTPEIGALLERGEPPPRREPAWAGFVHALTATRGRAWGAMASVVAAVAFVAFAGWPTAGDQLVAVRPRALAPLATGEEIYRLFGSRPGQWIVMSESPSRELAAARADAVAEALEPLVGEHVIDGYDALTRFAPSETAQRSRLAARDGLDLGAAKEALARELERAGFEVSAFAPALSAFVSPRRDVVPIPPQADPRVGWLVARHLREHDGRWLAVTYVRPRGEPESDARAVALIRGADPGAIVTGYAELEADLRRSLARDLPRITLIALAVVALGLRAALGRLASVALAVVALIAEIALLGTAMRLFEIRWHVYDALVVPVLIGITIDETMFLLFASKRGEGPDQPLRAQGALVASTALTTAAGFAALLACRFDGLRDLGAVGALGTVAGLVAALVVVPAGLRLSQR